MSVFNGAARLYLPGLTEASEDQYQHPLWLFQSGGDEKFIKNMAARVLPLAFLQSSRELEFPRIAILRDAAARHAAAQRPVANQHERLKADLAIRNLEYTEALEERDSWQSLALEEQARRLASDAELESFKQANARIEAKARALEYQLAARAVTSNEQLKEDRPLKSYDDLEDWAEEVLGEHVYIHQAALKDCRKNGHNNMLQRISDALIVIRDYVVPARMNVGLDRRELAREKLAELGMEDTPCFVDRDEARRTTGYSVLYGGESQILYDHIKYGNGYDNANQIRIYYFWDGEAKRFVIGKMPTHLRNNLTT
jgi:hypothetical protein